MNQIEELGLIAGRGVYPLELAQSARQQGVRRLVVAAFRGETDRSIASLADEVEWMCVGQLTRLLHFFQQRNISRAVMAGQIAPRNLFYLRPDQRARQALARLSVRNAETLFGAVAAELKTVGVELLPAFLFMQAAMPAPGPLCQHSPSEQQQLDIELGRRVAKALSGMDVGQTVVIKQGTILAVEGFEGTDKTLLRAGELGGPGAVIVKVAKRGHDMRFDIPVIGTRTLKICKKIKAAVLALEAGRTIILERERVVTQADRLGLSLLAFPTDD